jgi:hypothetical protein
MAASGHKRIALKVAVFVASVASLSWFFAGWRQVHEAQTLANWSLLAGSTLLTAFLVALQGYWIYFDEKAKGNLRKRINLYEKIHDALAAKPFAGACCGDGGDKDGKR